MSLATDGNFDYAPVHLSYENPLRCTIKYLCEHGVGKAVSLITTVQTCSEETGPWIGKCDMILNLFHVTDHGGVGKATRNLLRTKPPPFRSRGKVKVRATLLIKKLAVDQDGIMAGNFEIFFSEKESHFPNCLLHT